jgi:mono/diheme cytochrome c family protein
MKRLKLMLVCCSALSLPLGCSSSSPNTPPAVDARSPDAATTSPDAGAVADAPVADAPASDTAAPPIDTAAAPDAQTFPVGSAEARGQYLVAVLNCGNCHTPKVNNVADPSKLLSGVDCFVTGAGVCLSSANLTNDMTGIKALTDDQVVAALRYGVADTGPDGGATDYLFDRMPYYQYTNFTDADAKAIVAYLRAIPPVVHMVSAATGTYATRPVAPESAPVTLDETPVPSTVNASTSNGRYLASVICLNCHTQSLTADGGAVSPKKKDPMKVYQGGVPQMAALGDGGTKSFTSANLTPDTTGILGYTADDIKTVIKTGKNGQGAMLCAPMRAFPAMTDQDATDIGSYVLAIPAAKSQTKACN